MCFFIGNPARLLTNMRHVPVYRPVEKLIVLALTNSHRLHESIKHKGKVEPTKMNTSNRQSDAKVTRVSNQINKWESQIK